MKRAGIILIVAWMLPFAISFAGSISPKEIIEKVQDKYDDIEDATMNFVQSVQFKVSKAEQQSKGVLYFKKKNKYRIETDTRTVVTDGITSWSYNPQNNQLIVDNFKEESHSLAPDKLLTSFPKDHYATLTGKATVEGVECYVMKLTPKDENSFTSGMKIWVSEDWMIRKVEVTDINAAVTTYTITSYKVNTGLKAETFTYSTPKDADVIDLR